MAIFEGMNNKLRNGIAISILPQIFLVKWLSGHPEWVERYYSTGIYPGISKFFRLLFGWIPFSVGEIIYTALLILAVRYLIRYRKRIRRKPLSFLRNVFLVLAVFYFTFHLVWGLNYHREPISKNLGIVDRPEYEDILALTKDLLGKTNELQFALTSDSTQIVRIPYERNEVFEKTMEGYEHIKNELPFLRYQNRSIKKSMFSTLSSYMGIGGYLNPFTNEAQVNALTPIFRFPVISGHEIGHQVGYSAENETNFIGYLVTLKNKDPYFQYSAAAYGLNHCLNAVYRTDKVEFEKLYEELNEGTKKNYRELRDFNEAYKNPVEPLFESVFSAFLKANNQTDGIKSYSRVVYLMAGYHKLHPL